MTQENKELTQMGVLDIASKTHVADLGIKSTDKLVLLALCMHIYIDISKGYFCNPSHELLSKETGFKARAISQSIGVLQDLDYIKSKSSKYSNTYFINAALLMEKHNLWRQSFKDKVVQDNPYSTVSSAAMLGYNKVEAKKKDHNRDTRGLAQNQGKKVVQWVDDDDIEAPF